MGGWFKKEINTIEDLKGLKMRIPGFAGEIMAAVGAKPTNIPAGVLVRHRIQTKRVAQLLSYQRALR
jgi:TRAP-type mannitol/chloroaromatic compound transport system substrate-binding protein